MRYRVFCIFVLCSLAGVTFLNITALGEGIVLPKPGQGTPGKVLEKVSNDLINLFEIRLHFRKSSLHIIEHFLIEFLFRKRFLIIRFDGVVLKHRSDV